MSPAPHQLIGALVAFYNGALEAAADRIALLTRQLDDTASVLREEMQARKQAEADLQVAQVDLTELREEAKGLVSLVSLHAEDRATLSAVVNQTREVDALLNPANTEALEES